MITSITLHKDTNITVLKKNLDKYLIFYTSYYYIKYPLNTFIEVYFNKNCRAIELRSRTYFEDINCWKPVLTKNSYSLSHYFTKKIKFSGKSYKIKKVDRYFLFEFNKAHFELVIWKNMFIKKVKKNKILLFNVNESRLSDAYRHIIKIRPINPFTKRGLVGGRYRIMKKIGKKSS